MIPISTRTKDKKKLFSDINDAVKSFVADLKSNGLFNDVLLMTFSEFGRRVAQNASNGTDHGTANQMFFISGGLKKKGLLNALPNLQQLNEGDLIYTEDFRKVYATILKNWLKADSSKYWAGKTGSMILYDWGLKQNNQYCYINLNINKLLIIINLIGF